jgi:hypothetical protein
MLSPDFWSQVKMSPSLFVQLLGTPVTAPLILVNGFYIFGTTTTFNVDGKNGQTSVLGKRLLVWDQTTAQPGTIVGCTSGGLA